MAIDVELAKIDESNKYMTAQGDDRVDEAKKLTLKKHPDIDFMEEAYSVFDGTVTREARSFGSASKEEMSGLIDKFIRLGAEFGIEFEDPEAWKLSRMNIKY